ncbi:MAG TPA: IS1595 family transposase [Bacilli bacterium]
MTQSVTIEEFLVEFQSEEMCLHYLIQQKWPAGYACDRCGCRSAYRTHTRRLPLFECVDCRYQASPLVGTVIEGSRTPLRKWFVALFLLSQDTIKTNATELSRIINVTYKTGWLILQKIRYAIGQADANVSLSGLVSVTGAIYGQPYNPTFNRHPQETPALIGASMSNKSMDNKSMTNKSMNDASNNGGSANDGSNSEVHEPTYVKIKLVPDEHLNEKDILRSATEAYTRQHVEKGATTNYIIKRYIKLTERPTYPLFKESRKWINKTFHALGRRHLQAYLNEFCFRLNCKLRNTVSIFQELTQICTTTKTITYVALIG